VQTCALPISVHVEKGSLWLPFFVFSVFFEQTPPRGSRNFTEFATRLWIDSYQHFSWIVVEKLRIVGKTGRDSITSRVFNGFGRTDRGGALKTGFQCLSTGGRVENPGGFPQGC